MSHTLLRLALCTLVAFAASIVPAAGAALRLCNLQGQFSSLDLPSSTICVSEWALYCTGSFGQGLAEEGVELFFESGVEGYISRGEKPVFHRIGTHDLLVTCHSIFLTAQELARARNTFPFDQYPLDIVVRAYSPRLNATIPLIFVSLWDVTGTFSASHKFFPYGLSPDTQTRVREGWVVAEVTLRRSIGSIFAVLAVLLASWLATILTSVHVWQRKRAVSESSVMFPATGIAVAYTLRRAISDAPLGQLWLDFAAVIPQTVVLVIALLYILARLVIKRKRSRWASFMSLFI